MKTPASISAPAEVGRVAAPADLHSPGVTLISVGPLAPAPFELLHLAMHVDGERIVALEPHVGFAHCGLEAAAPRFGFAALPALAVRVDPLAPLAPLAALNICLERLCGVEAAPRGVALRDVALELERCRSHLENLAASARHHGARLLAQRASALARRATRAQAALAGRGGPAAMLTTGGVTVDLEGSAARIIATLLDGLAADIDSTAERWRVEPVLAAVQRGLGTLSVEVALGHSVTGPAARATGIARDLRAVAPPAGSALAGALRRIEWQPAMATGGGTAARHRVRWREAADAARLAAAILCDLPAGDHHVVDLDPARLLRPPAGIATARVEGPRGELACTLVADGGGRPRQLRMRSPSQALLTTLDWMARGARLHELPAIVFSLDLSIREIDR